MLRINKLRLLTLLIGMVCMAVTATAQTNSPQKELINKIKKSSSYLYVEVTMPDRTEAILLVQEMLEENIRRYVDENRNKFSSDYIVTHNSDFRIDTLSMTRGNMYRAFAYIKKSDIFTVQNVSTMTTIAAEQVATEVEVEPQPEEPVQVQAAETGTPNHRRVVQALLALERFDQIQSCINTLKGEGCISRFAKYADLENKEACILIIYNREGGISGLLSEGSVRTNLRTGVTDSVANYKGCGAIGVEVKD